MSQRFGTLGVLMGPGILCLGELFYALLKNLKASVMAQDASSSIKKVSCGEYTSTPDT